MWKKAAMTAVVVTTMAGATYVVGSLQPVFAQGQLQAGQDSLVEQLSARFKLQPTEVRAFFDEYHEQHRAEREQQFQAHLEQLVQEGKLTSAQKVAIEEKHASMTDARKENRENWDEMTAQEKKATFENMRQEMKSWADEQGIDMSLIRPRKGGRHDFGFK